MKDFYDVKNFIGKWFVYLGYLMVGSNVFVDGIGGDRIWRILVGE